ncbi:M24 family metallopeptidase [Paenibacillus uliginis]|uniref:M24 family metallopeptidase n=1 Tax=Paenibacillus uliginis TaxID=683737 RepID=UPI001AD84B54|nr:M24 family metallopeptidase [Paenibacillus uliginis]
MDHLTTYAYVQSIAKATMSSLKDFIQEGITERDIVDQTERIMRNFGIHQFWYYDVGAFVHVGERTIISESGKHYKPTNQTVRKNDIVTIRFESCNEQLLGRLCQNLYHSGRTSIN